MAIMLSAPHLTAREFAESQKAAETGDAVAQSEVGDMYASGNGLPKDPARAYAWYSLACASPETFTAKAAVQEKNGIEPTLAPEQKAQAEKLVAELTATLRLPSCPIHLRPHDFLTCSKSLSENLPCAPFLAFDACFESMDGGATWKKAADRPKVGNVISWSYDVSGDIFYAQTDKGLFRYAR